MQGQDVSQGGDYQKYMSQYGGDSQDQEERVTVDIEIEPEPNVYYFGGILTPKHMQGQGGSQGGDYQKHMPQYGGDSQTQEERVTVDIEIEPEPNVYYLGGVLKPMDMHCQGGLQGGDYQKHMPQYQYGGDSQTQKYNDYHKYMSGYGGDYQTQKYTPDEALFREEEAEINEEPIKSSQEILSESHHCRQGPIHRSGKQMRRRCKAFSKSKCAKVAERRCAKLDHKKDFPKVDVRNLHYSSHSTISYQDRFKCGQPVALLVQDLLDRKVRLSAPFLKLTVFETPSRRNGSVLRCMQNRRLFALKEYAKKSRKRVMVYVNLFSHNTINAVRRFMSNSDDTDGRDVRLRIDVAARSKSKQ